MSVSAEPREREALSFLDKLPDRLGGVLVGGYAISAYGPARFSDDVDLTFPYRQEESTTEWLGEAGIRAKRTFEFHGLNGPLSKLRIAHGLLSGDLYFGGLQSRETGSIVDGDWISVHSRPIVLSLTTSRASRPIAVARPEALWVLKILAGRSQDVTDLFAISSVPMAVEEVSRKLSTYDSVRERYFLEGVRRRVDRDEDYLDALSRRGLGSPKLARNLTAWNKFKALIDDVISPSMT